MSRRRFDHPVDDFLCGGFTAADGAEKDEGFIGANGETDLVDGPGGTEVFYEAGNFD